MKFPHPSFTRNDPNPLTLLRHFEFFETFGVQVPWSPAASAAVAPKPAPGGKGDYDAAPLRLGCRVKPQASEELDYCLHVRPPFTVNVMSTLAAGAAASQASARAAVAGGRAAQRAYGGTTNEVTHTHVLDHAFGPTHAQHDVFKALQVWRCTPSGCCISHREQAVSLFSRVFDLIVLDVDVCDEAWITT